MSNNTTIARPYAKAAFANAMQNNTVAAWSALLNMAQTIISDLQTKELLKNPKISSEQRLNFIADICKAVMHDPGYNFLKLLALHDRLLVLPEITELFETYRTEQEKIVNADIISAIALTTAEKEHLTQALKIRLQRDVTLQYHIDPALIGGCIIRAGDLVIDGSVRGKLTRLNTALAA